MEHYSKETFIKVNKLGVLPKISDVIGTNLCKIGVLQHNKKNHVIIASVIDNLLKGASGQAVQNMNIMMGWDQQMGLTLKASVF